jgi:hypothetical protein
LVAKWTSPAKDSVTGPPALLDVVAPVAGGAEVVPGELAADRGAGGELLPVQAGTASRTHSAVAANHVTGCTDRTPGV